MKELVSHSPGEYGYAFGCWTGQWLSKHLATEFGIEISDRHITLLRQTSDRLHQNIGINICDLQSNEASFHWSFNLNLDQETIVCWR